MRVFDNQPENRQLYVEFFTIPEVDTLKSGLSDHKVWVDKDYIKIVVDQYSTVVREVNEADKEKYARKWAQYKAQTTQTEAGIPLGMVKFLTPGQVKTLQGQDIHTVEQLAELSDTRCDHLGMGIKDLRAKAIKEIETRKTNEPIEDLQKQIEELRAQLKASKDELVSVQVSQLKKESKAKTQEARA